ncbi:sarcosine oxidase subunit gamma family protein [Albimonas pacifica]|uniref:Sarcosine oxidase, gamma subunit family, heterotetrameric form n=1 Tax=Albimonas pacifica TaxID=1114924 RepID=A0A1I3BVT4_9RHOB|nr:sarcosine oxidase subunit gamma family protein [Albimonas pacifica]SFH66434.1 sarcosine oxidase, gamma subunit family, heterotetrameric form [Albimonas pacifica]
MADALTRTPALAGAPSGRFGLAAGAAPQVAVEALADLAMAQAFAAPGVDLDARLAGRGELRRLGPGQRLVMGATAQALGDLAPEVSAVEQSGSRARIGVSGPGAAVLLARGVGADLHPSRFAEGASAPMLFGRIGIVLARQGAERWEVLVPRSYALSLWEELLEAGRSLGLEARGPGGR